MADTFTSADKAKCARREVGYRKRVFPRLVERGTVTQAQADHQVALMTSIAEDYERLAEADRQAAAPTLL